MFRPFRALTEALHRLINCLNALAAIQREQGPAEDRLDDLERSRSQWEAEVEGMLMKAEGKLQAANNAENRTRTMKKSYESLLDPLDLDSEEEPEALPGGYAPPGQEEGLQPVRVDVAPTFRQIALSRKFG